MKNQNQIVGKDEMIEIITGIKDTKKENTKNKTNSKKQSRKQQLQNDRTKQTSKEYTNNKECFLFDMFLGMGKVF